MPTVRQFTLRNQPWSGQESRISQSKAEAAWSLLLLFAKLGLRGRVIHLQLEMMQGREGKKERRKRTLDSPDSISQKQGGAGAL